MGLFDGLIGGAGNKAYKEHVRATQLYKQKKYDEAKTHFGEAMKLYEEAYSKGGMTAKHLEAYAILLIRFGDFVKAKEMLTLAFKKPELSADEKFDIRVDYAICLWKTGDLDKAIESMERAMQVKKNSTVYNTLGMFLIEKAKATGSAEDLDRAVSFNNEAMDYDDEDAGTLDNMAQLCMLRGDDAKALEYEAKAYEIKPEQVVSSYFYAKLLAQSGNKEKAKRVLSELDDMPITCASQISREMVEELKKKL